MVRRGDLEELGAESSDVEGIVEVLLNTSGVESSVLVVERTHDWVKLFAAQSQHEFSERGSFRHGLFTQGRRACTGSWCDFASEFGPGQVHGSEPDGYLAIISNPVHCQMSDLVHPMLR